MQIRKAPGRKTLEGESVRERGKEKEIEATIDLFTGAPDGVSRNTGLGLFACGIRDWLRNFEGYGIQIEQTSSEMRDRTKNQPRDAGNDLMFLRDTGFIHPIGGPFTQCFVLRIY